MGVIRLSSAIGHQPNYHVRGESFSKGAIFIWCWRTFARDFISMQ